METGEKSTLVYEVTREGALEIDRVRDLYINRLKNLQVITGKFFLAIISSASGMPYGLRFIAKVLKKELGDRWSVEEQANIVKTIGNLIYYRYMNPAVVAPEAFDVLDTLIDQQQRKNLAEISRMLQHISTKKHFEEEYSYLIPLNDFVTESARAFSKYLDEGKNNGTFYL